MDFSVHFRFNTSTFFYFLFFLFQSVRVSITSLPFSSFLFCFRLHLLIRSHKKIILLWMKSSLTRPFLYNSIYIAYFTCAITEQYLLRAYGMHRSNPIFNVNDIFLIYRYSTTRATLQCTNTNGALVNINSLRQPRALALFSLVTRLVSGLVSGSSH